MVRFSRFAKTEPPAQKATLVTGGHQSLQRLRSYRTNFLPRKPIVERESNAQVSQQVILVDTRPASDPIGIINQQFFCMTWVGAPGSGPPKQIKMPSSTFNDNQRQASRLIQAFLEPAFLLSSTDLNGCRPAEVNQAAAPMSSPPLPCQIVNHGEGRSPKTGQAFSSPSAIRSATTARARWSGCRRAQNGRL